MTNKHIQYQTYHWFWLYFRYKYMVSSQDLDFHGSMSWCQVGTWISMVVCHGVKSGLGFSWQYVMVSSQVLDFHGSMSWYFFMFNEWVSDLINAACLAEKQQILISLSLAWPNLGSNSRSNAFKTNTLTITPPRRYMFLP
jgi:hypothetical protein